MENSQGANPGSLLTIYICVKISCRGENLVSTTGTFANQPEPETEDQKNKNPKTNKQKIDLKAIYSATTLLRRLSLGSSRVAPQRGGEKIA